MVRSGSWGDEQGGSVAAELQMPGPSHPSSSENSGEAEQRESISEQASPTDAPSASQVTGGQPMAMGSAMGKKILYVLSKIATFLMKENGQYLKLWEAAAVGYDAAGHCVMPGAEYYQQYHPQVDFSFCFFLFHRILS